MSAWCCCPCGPNELRQLFSAVADNMCADGACRVSSGVLRPRPIGQAMMERALGVSQSPDVMMMGMSPAGHGVSPMAMSITPDGFMPDSLPQVLGRS